VANAELQPLEDEALSEVTGQAYFSIDHETYAAADDNVEYIRINLGMDIETQLNADRLEFGNYERDDPRGEQRDADIIFDDFSLGTIYDSDYYRNNPRVAMPLKEDGSRYTDGEIVPFKLTDPFIEFALDKNTGEPVGVRIGLGEAQGQLSAMIQSLTGDLNIDILDRGDGLKDASSNGNFFDQLVTLLAPYLTSGDPIQSKAVLLDANGDPDPIRATMAGIPNGEQFVIEDVNGLTIFAIWALSPVISSAVDIDGNVFTGGDISLTVQDCAVIGINTCFDLTQFQTLAIGKVTEGGDGRNYLTGPETGSFLSFQTKDLLWLKDVRNQNPGAGDFIQATEGSYLNIPNGLTLNLNEALIGIDRARTEYIDRGNGLF
jgi:hypothetical protein